MSDSSTRTSQIARSGGPGALRAPAPPGAHDFQPSSSEIKTSEPPSRLASPTIGHETDELSPLADVNIDRMWQQAGVSGIIKKMERNDVWAVDGPRQTIRSLITSREVVDTLVEVASDKEGARKLMTHERHVARFMAHLRTGRALALFRFLLERSPASAIRMVRQGAKNNEDRFMALLFERVQVLERSRILSRVFSPERIASLLEAIDDRGLQKPID